MQELNIPHHIAIMMDGNGRWAKTRNKHRSYGHIEGGKAFEKITKAFIELGIKYLTVFAFSTENWNRPQEEVDNIISLLHKSLKKYSKVSKDNNIKIRILGDITRLDKETQKRIITIEEETKDCTGLNLQIAVNYGGKDDIVRAIKKIQVDIENNLLCLEDINEDTVSNYLDTSSIPNPDLFIRTGGDKRISNFLLWQFAYTEFYFTKVLWPDFTKEDLLLAIQEYSLRERKFGEIHNNKLETY